MNISKVSKHTSYSIVSKNELPYHCPPKNSQKWNMHPKVFLQFNEKGRVNCPYCGAIYKLEN